MYASDPNTGIRTSYKSFWYLLVAYVKRLQTADETTGENKFSFDKIYHRKMVFSQLFFFSSLIHQILRKIFSYEHQIQILKTSNSKRLSYRMKVNFNCSTDLHVALNLMNWWTTVHIFSKKYYLLLDIIFNPTTHLVFIMWKLKNKTIENIEQFVNRRQWTNNYIRICSPIKCLPNKNKQ